MFIRVHEYRDWSQYIFRNKTYDLSNAISPGRTHIYSSDLEINWNLSALRGIFWSGRRFWLEETAFGWQWWILFSFFFFLLLLLSEKLCLLMLDFNFIIFTTFFDSTSVAKELKNFAAIIRGFILRDFRALHFRCLRGPWLRLWLLFETTHVELFWHAYTNSRFLKTC